MVSSTSWRISLPLREAKRFLTFSPEQQAKRYLRGSLRLARRLYQALPLSCQTKEAHRDALAKYLPRLLLVSGSHPATIPGLAASGNNPMIHDCREGHVFTLPEMDHSKLPDDFDPDVYLKLHPDLAAGGVDPATHYLSHGCHERRIYTLPELDICGDYEFKPDRETILVVSHEASRTGAPIASLNLVKAFEGIIMLWRCYWVAAHFPKNINCRGRR